MRDTSQKGLISHTAILNKLVQLGFEVLLPWADHLGYDLAYYVTEEHQNFGFFVHRESYLVRIQVKTAWLSKDGTAIEFNTSTVSAGKRGNKKSGYEGKAEYFGVFSPDTGKVYMVAVPEAAKSNMTLRLEGNAYVYPGTPVKWARDYEI
jgi:hypothetical protein